MVWGLILLILMIRWAIILYECEDSIIVGTIIWTLGLIASSLILGLTLVISSLFVPKSNYMYELTNHEEIVALQDSTGGTARTGSLGSAYINNSLYYYYMSDTEYGYNAGKINAENTYVRYCEDETPSVETYSAVDFKNKWLYLFAFPTDTYYVAYIPEGSIIENYQIDLE